MGRFKNLDTVNASATTGGVVIDVSGSTQDLTFTGGTGDDIVDFGQNFDDGDDVNGGGGDFDPGFRFGWGSRGRGR